MLQLPRELRGEIKREARRHDLSMNDYIVTVLSQFLDMQKVKRGTTTQEAVGKNCRQN